MEEETYIENNDSPNVDEEIQEDENLEDDTDDSEDVEELRRRNQSLYEQLKKAKGFVRDENGNWVKKETTKAAPKPSPKQADSAEITALDAVALAKADVHEDDLEDILEVAKLRKVSVREALKLGLTQAIIAKNQEFRKSAQAANTGPAKQSSKKKTQGAILNDLREGKVPDKGSDDAEALFWARRGGKR